MQGSYGHKKTGIAGFFIAYKVIVEAI